MQTYGAQENQVVFCVVCGRALSVQYGDYLVNRKYVCKRCQQRARTRLRRNEYDS